jgi:hypothetical protein
MNSGGIKRLLRWARLPLLPLALACGAAQTGAAGVERTLTLSWEKERLKIQGRHLPGGVLEIWYLEAFCRPASTRRDWAQTVIPHTTELVRASPDRQSISLRSRLGDGVIVDHEIRTGRDEVDFRVVATNPTGVASQAHWAQPCIRVDRFAGVRAEHGSERYLPRCFIYLDGKPVRLPTTPWARSALYTPGQVWCPSAVSRRDVNPRPLSPLVPSCGLIGCISADGTEIVATAWEPYQELFQGVIVCLHADFRIGGLKPGESKSIRGKIYLMPADFKALSARYRKDFPGQEQPHPTQGPAQNTKKIIEFGWDEPDAGFLRRHLHELEKSPFDGCVFHVLARTTEGRQVNFAWAGWGRRKFRAEELKQALHDASALGRGRLRHNFLRVNVTPADLDWFDDHEAVTSNARLAAQVARAAHADGILLDTEQYQGKLFDYRKQRDRARRSWTAYASQARRRGREVMAAMQEGFSDLRVLLTFGHSLVWKESERGKKPLADCQNGLLVPFLDGMIEAALSRTRLIDGYELSYGYRDAAEFTAARDTIARAAAQLAADPGAYSQRVSAGFGLWLDFSWRATGWSLEHPEKNYFSPGRFETSLRAALEQADEYVWIYTEQPRWWSEKGGAVDLPPVYLETVRQVRSALLAD